MGMGGGRRDGTRVSVESVGSVPGTNSPSQLWVRELPRVWPRDSASGRETWRVRSRDPWGVGLGRPPFSKGVLTGRCRVVWSLWMNRSALMK